MAAPAMSRSSGRAERLCLQRLPAIVAMMLSASAAVSAADVRLSTADRVLLAEYRAIGRTQAPMLIATTPARTGQLVAALQKRGAQIVGHRDTIGYVYAFVPLDALGSLLRLEGIEAAQVASNPVRGDAGTSSDAQSDRAAGGKLAKVPAPSAALGPDNPYTSEAATQALEFKKQHPTFDGRGVVTAFVEPVAPNMDTMRGALDLAGRPLPKIGRYEVTPTTAPEDAVSEAKNQMFAWQQTEVAAPAADGTFKWRERDYRLPARLTAGKPKWRICRHLANPIVPEYDILWDQNADRVWALPASAAGDFSQARSVSLRDAVPWIAVDPPTGEPSPVAAKALVIKVDRQRGWLAVIPTMSAHAGMVGSVMAGSAFLGSKADGIAPAAQIAIFMGASRPGAQTFESHEQMLEMISDPRVDVAEASLAVGDTSRFGSASIQSIWADRILARNGKPFVKAAGNFGTALGGSSEFEMSESVFAVGGYVPQTAWRANFGFEPAGQGVLASYSGWGPAEDGGLKPDFLSLTHTLAEGIGFEGYWDRKPGDYSVSGGTSAAGPHGAGHVALLVSAAKQSHIAHDALRLRAAIATSAKFLDGVEARAQGHGLVQVSDAWNALKRANDWTPSRFKIQAPLVGAEALPDGHPHFVGRGLFELGGWQPGQSGMRELTVTRTSGPASARRYQLRWKGHTDAFRSELKEVELPLGQPVRIPVSIHAGAAGSYSAILDLVDPQAQLVAGSILNTVMVADPLVPDGEGLRYEREAPRIGSTLFYVNVPAGLAALTLSVAKDKGPGLLFVTDPTGKEVPFNLYGTEVYGFDEDVLMKPELYSTLANPTPGVWQISLRTAEPRAEKHFQAVDDWSRPMPLKVHVQGWTEVRQAAATAAASRTVSAHLDVAPGVLDTFVEPLGLGAERDGRVTLRAGFEPEFFDVQVEPGTKSLNVQIEHADAAARVGLYVFKKPEGERVETTLTTDSSALVYYDSSLRREKRYTLEAPPPGLYRVAIDPISLAGERLEVSYRNVVHHPLFGTVSVSKAGEATIEVHAQPADGRRLYAEVGLFKRVNPQAPTLLARKGWFVR